MPLHRSSVPLDILSSVYADPDLMSTLPSKEFPADEMRPGDALQAIADELLLDGNARQNLATFCQTWEESEIHLLMDLSMNKNLIDKDEYPQTAELERRCVQMLAGLWHAPENGQAVGCSAIGSSEACMLGGMAAKWRWRAKRRAAGKPADTPNMVCGPVQVVWHKFARYWDVEMREVPMAPGRYAMEPEQMLERVDENTIMVVPTFGVTYTGAYERVLELSQALDKLHAERGLDVDIHVDGASGAFLAPFCAPDVEWDFRVPRVKSISTSGHKFGLAPLGVGWVLWRDADELPDDLVFKVNYLGGEMPTFALNFSRPGNQVIAQYYNFIRLGFDGYRRVQQASRDVATYLAANISELGAFDLITDGSELPVLAFTTAQAVDRFTVFDVSRFMREKGWLIPAYTFPANREDLAALRIVIRNGGTHDLADILVEDLKSVVGYLSRLAAPLPDSGNPNFHH